MTTPKHPTLPKPAAAVLRFWFETLQPSDWFAKNNALDKQIEQQFGQLHQQASQCELFQWRTSALGSLAEIIVLDQFSRNIYRDHPRAFSQDPLALALAQTVVANGGDQQLPSAQHKAFLYMPYMHSESAGIHKQAVALFSQKDLPESNLAFEHKHKEIIDRFGRYPHRNAILNRPSTPEEVLFLQQPGSGF